MNIKIYKYILVNNIKIAYTDRGMGQPILFIHGFASYSYTWLKLIDKLPASYRFITIDLKSFGFSEKICDDNLSLFDQSLILQEFTRLLGLKNVILVGHSMGGAVSLISLFNETFHRRISALILLDSAGLFQKLPPFIEEIASISPENPFLKIADNKLLSQYVLTQIFHDNSKITDSVVKNYCSILDNSEFYRKCLIAAARQIGIADEKFFRDQMKSISLPTMIIWGENDTVISLNDSYIFRDDLKAELFIISKCGHSPQEEMPLKTAELITDFLSSLKSDKTALNDAPRINKESKSKELIHHIYQSEEKLKMRKLIDRWSIGSVFLMMIIKALQVMKRAGFKVREDGWRKISSTFLRNEQSKFMLASFRLTFTDGFVPPKDVSEAKNIIMKKLSDFLRKTPATHWSMSWSLFKTSRTPLFFTDFLQAEFDGAGKLKKIIPYFDDSRPSFSMLNEEIIQKVLRKLVTFFNYNQSKKKTDHLKAWFVMKKLLHWTRRSIRVSHEGKNELQMLVRRLINASLISFETIPAQKTTDFLSIDRLKTPNTRLYRHPGFGLLNIKCRLLEDLSECDMWVQYHHVPVDGLPMQEIMQSLKTEFGEKGRIVYPDSQTLRSKTEIFYFGNRLFRARIFVDFSNFLKCRKYLNDNYINQMQGPATIASLIIWGLAQKQYFRKLKYLFPIDTKAIEDFPEERTLGIVAIRPMNFFKKKKPFDGFLKFEHEFNRRLFLTRMGKSETYEFLQLISLLHPSINYIFNKIFPSAVGEVFGTAGVTILKDAEMFVSPSTDIQKNGFIAIGKMDNKTADGKTCGAVNICGTKEQVKEYLVAIRYLAENLPEILRLSKKI